MREMNCSEKYQNEKLRIYEHKIWAPAANVGGMTQFLTPSKEELLYHDENKLPRHQKRY